MSFADTDQLVSRKEAEAFLRKIGCKISNGYLSNLARNDNEAKGPPFFRTGRAGTRVVYRLGDLETWWRNRLVRVE